MRIARSARLAVTAVALSTAVAACSSSGSDSSASGGITIKGAEFSWTAAKVTDAILADIVKSHPALGVGKISETQLDPATAWAGAARGDVQLLTEVALPNQKELADKAKGKVSVVSQTYGDAKQGWFVPKYVVESGGKAAGLTSVTQLNQYKSVFDGKFYDDDPGYITTQENTKRLAGYKIDYQHVISSEAAALAQLKKAYDAKQPIVLYLYHPHWVFAKYDMVQLTEPTPYTDGCLTTGSGACAMPAYSANIALSDSVAKQVPKFAALLKSLRISVPEMESMLKAVDVDKKDVSSVAADFVSQHSSDIASWTKSA
jgi:glycine betaine/proline transport system substrate-binding protein